MSFRRQRSIPLGGRYRQVSLYLTNVIISPTKQRWHLICQIGMWYSKGSNVYRILKKRGKTQKAFIFTPIPYYVVGWQPTKAQSSFQQAWHTPNHTPLKLAGWRLCASVSYVNIGSSNGLSHERHQAEPMLTSVVNRDKMADISQMIFSKICHWLRFDRSLLPVISQMIFSKICHWLRFDRSLLPVITGSKLLSNLNQWHIFENIICDMSAILSRNQ